MSSTIPENLRRLMDIIDENKEALPEGAYLEAGKIIMAQVRPPLPPLPRQPRQPRQPRSHSIINNHRKIMKNMINSINNLLR